MFGFQRTGDAIWAAGDQMARGFMIGATAGRTTLTGEGLQHADGHSLMLASTNPAVDLLRPGVRLRDRAHHALGIERMYGGEHKDPNVMYYLTVYNEPMRSPGRARGRRRRGYRSRSAPRERGQGAAPTAPRSSHRASPCRGRSRRRKCSPNDWGVAADVWSVTSWYELRRDGLAAERAQLPDNFGGETARPRTSPTSSRTPRVPWLLSATGRPEVPDQIRPFVPG